METGRVTVSGEHNRGFESLVTETLRGTGDFPFRLDNKVVAITGAGPVGGGELGAVGFLGLVDIADRDENSGCEEKAGADDLLLHLG